jgi:hypothetical protein
MPKLSSLPISVVEAVLRQARIRVIREGTSVCAKVTGERIMMALVYCSPHAGGTDEERPKPADRVPFDPAVKASLSLIAERDGRSMANMLEWLIRRHCEAEGLGWPPAGCRLGEAGKPPREQAAPGRAVGAGKVRKGKRDA